MRCRHHHTFSLLSDRQISSTNFPAKGSKYSQPAVKTTCILNPIYYKDHIFQVPRGILSVLLNLHIKATCVQGPY